ncbi:hypothetical protein IIA28_14335 [candidate division KSB1 bacterium]|nr:hypothetical protein [candidate division KSB1 bacterium]
MLLINFLMRLIMDDIIHIAKDSADRAALFIERLIEAADRLEDLPYRPNH